MGASHRHRDGRFRLFEGVVVKLLLLLDPAPHSPRQSRTIDANRHATHAAANQTTGPITQAFNTPPTATPPTATPPPVQRTVLQ